MEGDEDQSGNGNKRAVHIGDCMSSPNHRNKDENPYLIFQVLYQTKSAPYFIFMFKNICQKFLISDSDLRRELLQANSIF